MSFYVVYAKAKLTKLRVVKADSVNQLQASGHELASRKNWGFRKNANWYARQLTELNNLSLLGGNYFPLD